jgi:hypothetical protein
MTRPQPRGTRTKGPAPSESIWRLLYDLVWGYVLLWFASFGRSVSPLPGVHLFFADRYFKLAAHCDLRGYPERAASFRWRGEFHEQSARPDPDEPDPAVAAVGTVPFVAPALTDARGHAQFEPPPRITRFRPKSTPHPA